MIVKTKEQPLCRACGKPIAKYADTVYLVPKITEYTRSHSGSRYVAVPEPVRDKAGCQRLTNGIVTSVNYTVDYVDGEPDPKTRRVHHFGEWDGESYWDLYFCNGTCRTKFAYAMAEQTSWALQSYWDAHKKRLDNKRLKEARG